jgi:DNA-binding LytR/AlgR family response regulator
MKNDKVNILVVEDEAIVAMDLAASLTKEGYTITGIADNAEDAEDLFKSKEPDIALVDINLVGKTDGISLVEKLIAVREVPVIYLTAQSDAETVQRMKLTRPAAYITKPYSIQNVHIAIELALSNFALMHKVGNAARQAPQTGMHAVKEGDTEADKEQILQLNEYIFIKQNYRFIKVMLDDILYVEADNNYIHVVTAEKKYTVRMSLQQLEERVNYARFIRVHRSYIVNMSNINNFTDAELQTGKFTIPIGRNYRDSFIKQFNFR